MKRIRLTRILIGGVISASAIALITAPVLADSVSSEGAINNIDPVISAVSMKNGDGTAFATPADCETEYRIDFTIADDNTLEDLTDIEI